MSVKLLVEGPGRANDHVLVFLNFKAESRGVRSVDEDVGRADVVHDDAE